MKEFTQFPEIPDDDTLKGMDWVTPEMVENLFKYLDGSAAVKKLSNAELAELILEHLWAHLPVSNPASWVLDEVIDRLAPELKDEPFTARCNHCGRKSWDKNSAMTVCGLTQPDKSVCGGIMIPNDET